jgi:hypothetical protein
MQATAERTSDTKPRARPLTKAEKELKAMKAYMKKVNSSKKTAEEFLRSAGIIDKNGELAKQYRS